MWKVVSIPASALLNAGPTTTVSAEDPVPGETDTEPWYTTEPRGFCTDKRAGPPAGTNGMLKENNAVEGIDGEHAAEFAIETIAPEMFWW